MRYAYLIATLPALLLWGVLYWRRKDLRKEMLSISFLVGFLSVASSYYWCNSDWWQPATITGTKVGAEDFLMGFSSGGIMAVVYEVVTVRRYSKRRTITPGLYGFFVILLLIGQTTSWLFYGVGLTSFYAITTAMLLAAVVIFSLRRDLFLNGLISGVCAVIVSLPSYFLILFFFPGWIDATYRFSTLSGVRIFTIPIEEFIFWFLAGLVFGPFYEFWKGIRLRRTA